MCTVCGCGQGETKIEGEAHAHTYVHAHEHRSLLQGRPHAHASRMVQVEQDILAKNNQYASANRRHFAEHGIFALNLVSSPGSGKTALLTRTIERLKGKTRIAVIEGDQQTSLDADRIRATGVSAVQINTGKGCHLDATMVRHGAEELPPLSGGVLFIENVGNLVCPAAFDLGEAHKVAILSVTEGEDKPLKYPDMFHAADLMILNKVDLLPHLDFDVARCIDYAQRVNPKLEVLQVSATRGQGMDAWLAWLLAGLEQARATRLQNVEVLKQRIAELEAQLAAGG